MPTSAQVMAALRSPSAPVYLKRTSATHYTFMQEMGGSRYWALDLRPPLTSVPGSTVTILARSVSVVPSLTVDDLDAAWAYGGTWTVLSNNHRSVVTGSTATWTTPANTDVVILACVPASNCGLAKVAINGDATRATLLPTAQELVDAGTYANTILVANGGTLNPTDRVWDQFTGTATQRLAADGLTPGAHTVVVTVTGYKRAAATDVRVIVDSGLYHATGITPSTASVTLFEDARLFSNGASNAESNYEFAHRMTVGGASGAVFMGGVHGRETQAALTFTVDAVPSAPVDGQTVTGTEIIATRTSALTHPDVGAGVTTVCDVTTTYTLNQDGLKVDHTDTWRTAMTSDATYMAMLPVSSSGGAAIGLFDRASSTSVTTDATMTANDDSRKATGAFDTAWHWTATGKYGAAVKLNNRSTALAGDVYNQPLLGFIEDRVIAGSFAINKVYFPRTSDTSTTDEAVTSSSVWTSSATYRTAYLADPNASLSQASVVTVTGAQAAETDTAAAGAPAVTVQGAQATDTSTAVAGSPLVRLIGGQAVETDAALLGAVLMLVPVRTTATVTPVTRSRAEVTV